MIEELYERQERRVGGNGWEVDVQECQEKIEKVEMITNSQIDSLDK